MIGVGGNKSTAARIFPSRPRYSSDDLLEELPPCQLAVQNFSLATIAKVLSRKFTSAWKHDRVLITHAGGNDSARFVFMHLCHGRASRWILFRTCVWR